MNKVIVKISGKTIDEFITGSAGADLVNYLKTQFSSVIIIHGGGKTITEWSNLLGVHSSFYKGQRITDTRMMEITAAVQGGLINSKLTAYLLTNKIQSIGLNGIDMGLFTADQIDPMLGFVGNPKPNESSDWLDSLLLKNVVPVFSSICRNLDGNLMNVNADLFAGSFSKLLNANTVIFFSDVEGIRLNNKYQKKIAPKDLRLGLKSGEISDGMIPKITACLDLINHGINNIWIGNNLLNFKADYAYDQKGTWILNG